MLEPTLILLNTKETYMTPYLEKEYVNQKRIHGSCYQLRKYDDKPQHSSKPIYLWFLLNKWR